MFRPGEWVAQGSPVVALLPAGQSRFGSSCRRRPVRVRIGDSVAVSCDGCPPGMTARVAFVRSGRVHATGHLQQRKSREARFMVEAKPDEKTASQLRPGQPVDVRIAAGS